MSDRLIAWLDHCGYEIVKKRQELAAKAVTRELHAEVVDA